MSDVNLKKFSNKDIGKIPFFEPGLGHDFMKWFDGQYNIECHVKNIRHVHPRNVHNVWMLNATQ